MLVLDVGGKAVIAEQALAMTALVSPDIEPCSVGCECLHARYTHTGE